MSCPFIQWNFSLKKFNSFRVDVKTYAYISIECVSTLISIKKYSNQLSQLPRLILGGGSNILFMRDFCGLVLHMRTQGMCVVKEDKISTYVKAAAGQNWHCFVQWTLAQGLGGLENLSFIPGSVGGAPVQNIGAYGVEIQDRLHSLTVFDFIDNKIVVLDNQFCRFAYRDSIFKHEFQQRFIILDVTFALPKKWKATIYYKDVKLELSLRSILHPSPLDIAQVIINLRTRKLPNPKKIGNAGSFFKNPIVTSRNLGTLLLKYPKLINYIQANGQYRLAAGYLVDYCGWRGSKLGAAGVYKKQALVLINLRNASGKGILRLARIIQIDVFKKFGVILEPEVILI